MPKIKCIILDVSGTLFDAQRTISIVDRKFMVPWLNKRGYNIDINMMMSLREKYPGKEFYMYMLKEMKWKMKKSMLKDFIELFRDLYFFSLVPFEGVVYTLKWLRRKGILLVVVSNSKREHVKKALEKLDFNFDKIVSFDETNSTKQSLEPFNYILDRLILKPEECLMIGDRLDEDAFCRKLGIKFVWFPHNRRNYSENIESYDYVIREFRELRKIIDSIDAPEPGN